MHVHSMTGVPFGALKTAIHPSHLPLIACHGKKISHGWPDGQHCSAARILASFADGFKDRTGVYAGAVSTTHWLSLARSRTFPHPQTHPRPAAEMAGMPLVRAALLAPSHGPSCHSRRSQKGAPATSESVEVCEREVAGLESGTDDADDEALGEAGVAPQAVR